MTHHQTRTAWTRAGSSLPSDRIQPSRTTPKGLGKGKNKNKEPLPQPKSDQVKRLEALRDGLQRPPRNADPTVACFCQGLRSLSYRSRNSTELDIQPDDTPSRRTRPSAKPAASSSAASTSPSTPVRTAPPTSSHPPRATPSSSSSHPPSTRPSPERHSNATRPRRMPGAQQVPSLRSLQGPPTPGLPHEHLPTPPNSNDHNNNDHHHRPHKVMSLVGKTDKVVVSSYYATPPRSVTPRIVVARTRRVNRSSRPGCLRRLETSAMPARTWILCDPG